MESNPPVVDHLQQRSDPAWPFASDRGLSPLYAADNPPDGPLPENFSHEHEDNGLSGGAIFGIIVAILLIGGVAAGGAYYYLKVHRKKKRSNLNFERFTGMGESYRHDGHRFINIRKRHSDGMVKCPVLSERLAGSIEKEHTSYTQTLLRQTVRRFPVFGAIRAFILPRLSRLTLTRKGRFIHCLNETH